MSTSGSGLESIPGSTERSDPHSKIKAKGKITSTSESAPLLPRYEDEVLVSSLHHPSDPSSSISYGTTPTAIPPAPPPPYERLWSITKSTFAKLSTIFIILAFFLMIVYLLQINSLREEIVKVPQLNIEEVNLDSFSSDGINVKVIGFIQPDYEKGLKGSKFRKSVIKLIGGLIGSIDAGEQNITLYFDQNYDQEKKTLRISDDDEQDPFVHTANATVPPITVDTHHLHNTTFDFIVKVKDFGNPIVIGTIAQRLLANEALHFKAHSKLPISKWGTSFGKYEVDFDQVINNDEDNDHQGGDLDINLTDIKVIPNDHLGLDVITQLSTENRFSIESDIPSLIWELKIPGCSDGQSSSYQLASKGRTYPIHLIPHSTINITVESNLLQLPIELLFPCDNENEEEEPRSPLDMFIQRYMSGKTNLITIEGSSTQDDDLPYWLADIIKSISFTVPFEGKTDGDDLIQGLEFKNFRLALPPANQLPIYQPGQPPRVSATVRVRVKTPDLINIDPSMDLKVPFTRGKADLFSNGEHFAHIDIDEWIPCITEHGQEANTYLIEFSLDSVPIEVVDQTVFGRVMREVIVSGSSPIRVEAVVDAEVSTPIGELLFTDLPAQGDTEIRSS